MDRYQIIELSKLYKRLLSVEIRLKEHLISNLQKTYHENGFNRIIDYLKNNLSQSRYIKISKKRKRSLINDIINSSKTQEEKLKSFCKIAYLFDILKILFVYEKIRKDNAFKRNFFNGNIPTQNEIERNATLLNNLRNAVMHFNYTLYLNNKTEYLKALSFWERLLYCPNCFIHDLPPVNPTTKNILRLIKDYYPEIFESDDRLVVDFFDDIAFLNGMPIKKLPQYWSIGRQWYILKNEKTLPIQ